MTKQPITSKRCNFHRVGLIALIVSVCALSVSADTPKKKKSDQILAQIEALAAMEQTEARIDEIDALWKEFDKEVLKEQVELDKAKGKESVVKDKSEGSKATPKPKARPKRTPKPKPTATPKPAKRRNKTSPKQDDKEKNAPSKRGKSSSTRKGQPSKSRRGKPAPSRVESVSPQPEINVDAENYLKPFFQRQYSFSIKDGDICRVDRIVCPYVGSWSDRWSA